MSEPAVPQADKQQAGRRAFFRGHAYEWLAAIYLIFKGYRILGFRVKTRAGEIDLVALKHQTLVLIEVKQRQSLDEGLLALSPDQMERIGRAGEALLKSRPDLRGLGLRLDLIVFAGQIWPRHNIGHGLDLTPPTHTGKIRI